MDDNVTPYVRSLTFQRGGQFDLLGGQTPGKATIIVNNADGRWNDRNASGPYYGQLAPGKKVWIGMRDSSDPPQYYPLFAGYIDEIAPVPGADKYAQLIVSDPFGLWQSTPAAVEFAENRSVSEFRRAILQSLGVPDANLSIDAEEDALAASGARSDNALAVLEELNKSVATRHWIEPAADKNDFFFYVTRNRNRNLGFTHDDDLSEDDIIAMDGYRMTRESIVNILSVNYTPVKWNTGSVEDLWQADGPIAMPVGTTRIVVAFSTWVKGIIVSGTFENVTGSAVVTNYGKGALIELTDDTADNVVTGLKLTGYNVESGAYQPVYEAYDTASQVAYRKKAGSAASGEYIQTSAIAQAIGESVVARSHEPRTRPQVRFRNRYDKFLPNGLYSVVQQSLDELSLVDEQYEIIGLAGAISEGDTLREFSWTYLGTTIPANSGIDLFILDQSTLDGGDVLGF